MRRSPVPLALVCLATFLAPPSTPALSSELDDLRAAIQAADSALFDAIFETCEPDKVAALVTDDFEFFHDKWGQIAQSKGDFVTAIRGSCERQRQGTDFKARRRLNLASLEISAMKSYGALEIGEHAFFKRNADGSLTPTEHARFTHLWRLHEGKWLLARVISHAHVDGPAPWATPLTKLEAP